MYIEYCIILLKIYFKQIVDETRTECLLPSFGHSPEARNDSALVKHVSACKMGGFLGGDFE
jgi:hypothetical protein